MKLTISIPRDKLADDALARLRIMVSNKEELFKRALLADELPIIVTEDQVSFPWFTLTGVAGESTAYAQFITALCKMASEQKRVLDKPYDGDNDRFAMRIFIVRLNMKGAEFALARKLMMKHLDGNSGWRYEDSANKPEHHGLPNRAAVQHLKKAYPKDTRIELVPMNDEISADIEVGACGKLIGVDDNGSVFIALDNGSRFGIAFSSGERNNAVDAEVAADDVPDDGGESTTAETASDLNEDTLPTNEIPEDISEATTPEDAESEESDDDDDPDPDEDEDSEED